MIPIVPHDIPLALQTVATRPLFALQLQTTASEVGRTPMGVRRSAAVDAGAFLGGRVGLRGKVQSGGNDWIYVSEDGSVRLDARITLETESNERILMSYRGIRCGPRDVLDRLANGETVDPETYYFRITPWFEAGAGEFEWMNRIAAIGVGHRLPDGVLYQVFEVL